MHELSDQLLQAEEKGHSNDSLAQEDKRPALLVTEALKAAGTHRRRMSIKRRNDLSIACVFTEI